MSKQAQSSIASVIDRKPEFVRENGLMDLGLKPRYLQKDRLLARSSGGPKIPFYRQGRMILYRRSEVEAIILAGRVEAKT